MAKHEMPPEQGKRYVYNGIAATTDLGNEPVAGFLNIAENTFIATLTLEERIFLVAVFTRWR
jgi:hypothetical protein